MAADLRIEIFAYDLFNSIWIQNKIMVCASPSIVECKGSRKESNFNEDILKAVNCRQLLFHDQYQVQFFKWNVATLEYLSDFFAFINYTFQIHFNNSAIFEFILATCAYIAELVLYCCSKGNFHLKRHAYLCWAMYINSQQRSQFYERGGWEVLKCTAKSYTLPHMILRNYSILDESLYYGRIPFDKFIKSMMSFRGFHKFCVAQEENESCAKTWVNFHLKNKSNKGDIAGESHYDAKSMRGLEKILTSLEILCHPPRKQQSDLNNFRQKGSKDSEWNIEKLIRLSYLLDTEKSLTGKSLTGNVDEIVTRYLENIPLTANQQEKKYNQTSQMRTRIWTPLYEDLLKSFDIESWQYANVKYIWDHVDGEQNIMNLDTGIISKTKPNSKDFKYSNDCSPQSEITKPTKRRNIRDVRTKHLTTSNVTPNQEGNNEIQDGHLNTVISLTHLDRGHLKSTMESLPIQNCKCITDLGGGEQNVKNVNTEATAESNPTSKEVKYSNGCSPQSKERKICDVQTRHLTTNNKTANHEENQESLQGHLETGISPTHLEGGHLKSTMESLQIQNGKCITDLMGGEQKVKNVNTETTPKSKPTSKDVKISNNSASKSKEPTTEHEMTNAGRNRKKNKKRQRVKPEARSSTPIHVNHDGTSKVNSYEVNTKAILRIIVITCQTVLNYVLSTFKAPRQLINVQKNVCIYVYPKVG